MRRRTCHRRRVPPTCDHGRMDSPGKAGAARTSRSDSTEEGRSGQLSLIRAVLAQSPEQRLEGLRRAADFFQRAKRA